MSWELWLVFVPACFALNMAPGPNNLLAMSNGVRFGFPRAAVAGGGRLVAFAAMIALTAVGLGALLAASETAFHVIKWCGAVYLVYLGVKLWRTRPDLDFAAAADARPATPLAVLLRQEFLIAASNPKAILIFTAFFPQFLVPGQPAFAEFAVMGATFLVLEAAALAIYAISGRQLAFLTRTERGQRLISRVSGGMLVGAGVLLATARR
ncbi:MAG: LysE family transporter [Rhodospirillaceae bacterium]|nr:LysE family transporter [Rhodospirillaceae bacterium]